MTRGPYRKSSAQAHPGTLGQRIKKIRVKWGWSQQRLANELGTDQQALSRWERGLVEPTSATLRALQDLFGLSEEALTKGKGFRIPGLPLHFGAARVAESYGRDLVVLPEVEGAEGKVVLVSRNGAESTHEVVSRSKAHAALDQSLKSGMRVWVVVD